MSQGWSKIFNRINWLNRPSTNTPLNATNLNAGDSAIDKLDDRIITLDTVKADMQVVNGMVADISVNDADGVITVTYKNGSTNVYDTNLEKIAINFTYDYSTQRLVLTLSDGSKQYVDMSALITQYEFKDSTTIAFSVDSTGKVSAYVKNGSITEAMLETGYLANIKVEVAKAEASATQAQSSEASSDYNAKLSRSYAIGGSGIREGEDADNAMYYYEQAKKTDIGQISSEVAELNSNLTDLNKLTGDKSILFNQLIPLFSSSNWVAEENASVSFENNVATVTNTIKNFGIKTISNEKQINQNIYYFSFELKTTSKLKVAFGWGEGGGAKIYAYEDTGGVFKRFYALTKSMTNSNSTVYIWSPEGIGTFSVKNAKVVNLTKMFGAGKEPNIKEFENLFPNDYYEKTNGIPISNIGIASSIERVNDSLEVLGKCKNLLNPTLKTTTSNGVTCTNNGDGTYTLNGTVATGNYAQFTLLSNKISAGTYKLVGNPDYSLGCSLYFSGHGDKEIDYGNGGIVNFASDITTTNLYLYIPSGVTLTNVVFKPMLTTNLNATYDDFVPYTGDGETLTEDVAELKNDLAPQQTNLVVESGFFVEYGSIDKINGVVYINMAVYKDSNFETINEDVRIGTIPVGYIPKTLTELNIRYGVVKIDVDGSVYYTPTLDLSRWFGYTITTSYVVAS